MRSSTKTAKGIFEREGKQICLINTEVMMLRRGSIIFSGKDEQLRLSDDPYIMKFIRGKATANAEK